MIKPLSNHVVLEAVKEDKKKGAILLPETVKEEKSEIGTVVAVGPGKVGDTGTRVPVEVKKGDTVVFSKFSPHRVKISEKEYLIVRQDDILAIVD
ncbi:MAG TPA: co-chaperone GroES [Candidatus Paceibacterota bacterium]|nr:co-chaperone GroES [Candidatus Paceibacterota bacterium]